MLPLDLLGMPFARAGHVRIQMPGIGAPMIRRKASEPQGLEQCFELQKDFICATTKDRGQNLACVVIDGMPQPALVAFLADTTPHLVALSFPSVLHVHDDLCWIYGTQQRGMDRCEGG